VLSRPLFNTVQLLVTELVTNSVRHSRSPANGHIELTAVVYADRVRVEVCDHGRGFEPRHGPPDRESASGWGLYLVDRLSQSWGMMTDGETRVWLEIDR
jgi:anti-sigma regulatory factor (Ser/Thr protein kinase)